MQMRDGGHGPWASVFSFLLAGIVLAIASTQLSAQQPTDTLARRQQRTLDSLVTAIQGLKTRMDSAARSLDGPVAAPVSAPVAPTRTAGAYMNVGFVGLADFGWSSAKDVSSLQVGDHDPLVRGFTIPNAELTLDGAVDPYFKGFANIVTKLDPKGETAIELEEMFALTTSLPGNFQIKAGQFLTDFGRQNAQHPHAWSFVDQPLVLGRVFGREGLRSQGIRVSWLVPTPWYTEAMVSVLNSAGGTTFSFRSDQSSEIHGGTPEDRPVNAIKDLLIVPRVATSFDLTSTQTVLVGVSGAFGPNNSGPSSTTQIYGADLYWKWKSARASQGFPFVSWQTEGMVRRYHAARRAAVDVPSVVLPAETLTDGGFYSQVLWGIKPRWVAGLRGEFVGGSNAVVDLASRADRVRVSPSLTWYPTEFSKLRLQYNFDDRHGIGRDHSLWVQFEFTLGAHAAHKF